MQETEARVSTFYIPGKQSPHHRCQANRSCPKQEVIGNKCPRKTAGTGPLNDSTEPIQIIIAIGVVLKNPTTLNSSGRDEMQSPRCIYSRLSRHDRQ